MVIHACLHVLWARLRVRAWKVSILTERPLLIKAQYFGISAVRFWVVVMATEALLGVTYRIRTTVFIYLTGFNTFAL